MRIRFIYSFPALAMPVLFAAILPCVLYATVTIRFDESGNYIAPYQAVDSSLDDIGYGTFSDPTTGTSISISLVQSSNWTRVPDQDPISSGLQAQYGGATNFGAGEYSYTVYDVTFGSVFGPSGNSNLISATDFLLNIGSPNGTSAYYEWAVLDLKGDSTSFTQANLNTYLSAASNYNSTAGTEIGTAVGAVASSDGFNHLNASGVHQSGSGNDSGNTNYDNTDFGIAANTGISGFTLYMGLGSIGFGLDPSGSTANHSINSFSDSMSTQAVPEPSSFLFLGLIGIAAGVRRRYSRQHICPQETLEG